MGTEQEERGISEQLICSVATPRIAKAIMGPIAFGINGIGPIARAVEERFHELVGFADRLVVQPGINDLLLARRSLVAGDFPARILPPINPSGGIVMRKRAGLIRPDRFLKPACAVKLVLGYAPGHIIAAQGPFGFWQ